MNMNRAGRIMSKNAMDCDAPGPYSGSEMIADKRTLIYSPIDIERNREASKRYELEDVLRLIGERLTRNYPCDDYRIYTKDLEAYGNTVHVDAVLEALTEAGWAVGFHSDPSYFQFNGSL